VTIPADPRLGTRLAGYRIQALLGRGGMGVVYLAEQLGPRRPVALKLLSAQVATSEAFRERFLRESELAATIDHPNVLPVYDAGETDGVLWIAMRYVGGIDLAALLEREGRWGPSRRWRSAGRWRGRWTPPTPAGWSTATSSRPTSCWPWRKARSPTPTWPTSG
jgi:serine/threonine protein kinase